MIYPKRYIQLHCIVEPHRKCNISYFIQRLSSLSEKTYEHCGQPSLSLCLLRWTYRLFLNPYILTMILGKYSRHFTLSTIYNLRTWHIREFWFLNMKHQLIDSKLHYASGYKRVFPNFERLDYDIHWQTLWLL